MGHEGVGEGDWKGKREWVTNLFAGSNARGEERKIRLCLCYAEIVQGAGLAGNGQVEQWTERALARESHDDTVSLSKTVQNDTTS